MLNSYRRVRRASQSRILNSAASTLVIALVTTPSAMAQTIINNGDNVTVTSANDGETISAAAGVTSEVNGGDVVIFNNNNVTLDNAGTLRALGAGTNTVRINDAASGGVVNNAVTGRLEGASRVVDIQGDDFTLNNEGTILGVGDQRNGTVYANRTANNFNINNIGTASVIDAGVGNNGAGVSIELGGGGGPITGTIANEGLIQGRGQVAAPDNTAGDGIRFFGPGLAPTYSFVGDITNSGTINSESAVGPVAGVRFSNNIQFTGTLTNEATGVISGVNNGLYFGDADHTGGVVNNAGTISSDSRALNIDGAGLVVNNSGSILGTGNQRNGTVYADSTAQDFTLNNLVGGIIDAGVGNEGAGFSVELSEAGNDFVINNAGDIFGRGNVGAGLATAGDGLRFERTRVGGALDGTTSGLFTGDIVNSGVIDSEAANGTAAGIRFVNGVSFNGTIDNSGTISGVQNGLYFGNATPAGGGDFTGAVVNNSGTISSGSRALNIDGLGLVVNNSGSILGTGNQRNGTVYADQTAQGFALNNLAGGVIDAGAGLEGAGFSVELAEVADGGNDFTIDNAGTIQGRGNAGAGLATAGDGLRFERTRVGGALDGTTSGLFTGDIVNSGVIDSEAANGTAAGIRFVNGVSFNGTIDNSGTISGVQNGLYFGNATPAGGGDFTGAVVNNSGTISSGSRALNIDGLGLVVNNSGSILGTGDQRNGTVYADSTAQDFTLNNLVGGIIDAGAGNEGAGFSVELAEVIDGGNDFTIDNAGTIQGRGNAGAGLATAGDGLRFERTRVGGALDGTTSGLFTGDIVNSGVIDSEAANGTAAGIRFVNGVSFNGTIDNSGTISGVQNGLYFGNATPAGGGDFTGAVVNNSGTISSGSRALNIDGLGLVVNNSGSILGTGDQRNGTVYADATANAYTFNNLAGGVVDAGDGNNGSGVSLQSGNVDGETVSFTVNNAGTIAGRGDALASGASAGLRIFNGAANVSVDGTIINSGDITSETAAAVLIENVDFIGSITNSGTLTGASSFDASSALSGIAFTQTGGALNGDFIGSAFADTLTFASGSSTLNGSVLGGVATTIADGASVSVSGVRSLEGNLVNNGTLGFGLGADSLAVEGDVTLGADSIINVVSPGDVTALTLGAPITVLSETGAFVDNGVTVNIEDNDFLIDFTPALGSLAITPTVANLAAVSADANVSAFGAGLTTALNAGQLNADVANFLNASTDASSFETNAVSLLPAINEGVTREIFETQSLANDLIENRLRGEGNGLWGQFLYRNADRDADSVSASGYDADAFGFSVGYDRQLSEAVKAGLSFNYANIDIDADNGQESDIDAFQVSAYAGYEQGAWFANGIVGYSFNNVDAERTTQVGSITSESDVDGFNLQGVLGYDLAAGTARIAPVVGIHYANLSEDAFTESGGLNFAVDPENVSFLDLKAGFEASTEIQNGDWTVRPLARAAYVYDAIGDARVFNASFSGQSFALQTADPAQSRVEVGAGLELANASGVALSVEYDGEFADGYTSNGGFLRARFNF